MDIFKNYCQFCLEEQSSDSLKVPIDREIKQKFLELTALKLTTAKFCEFICCEPCLTSLNSSVNFRDSLIRNQQTLAENLKKFDSSTTVEVEAHDEYILQEEASEVQMVEDPIQCDKEVHLDDDYCSSSEITIIEALESETEETENLTTLDESHMSQYDQCNLSLKKKYPKKRLNDPISCPKCDRQFYYKAYFQFHYKDVHREDREEICQYCGKIFKNSRRLNSHLVVHQNNSTKKHKCEICGKQFNFSGDLVRHKRVHDNVKPFKCPLCTKSFIQSYALKLHLDVHNKIRFGCDLCGANFSGKPTLKKHIAKCINGQHVVKTAKDISTSNKIKEKYKCISEGCDRQFASRKYLKIHLDKSHNMTFEQFETTCLECLAVFDNVGDYSIHVKTHSCNFVCELCKLRFRTGEKLQAHIDKTHKDGEKRPFICTICDAKFKRVEHLKGHIDYKHSVARRFQCEFCELKFRQRGEFNVHIRVHRNENPFNCWQCNHTCKTSSNLRQHMSLVHNENCIYYCKACGKSFRYNNDLNRHNKEHHAA